MNGVDVEFVSAGVSAIDGDAQVATCQQFGQDDQVFAVLTGRDFTSGAECMASRFNTPVISVNQAPADLYAQAGPDFFTVKPDETTITTSFAEWALANGYLEGKKVGIYWDTSAKPAVDAMKQVLTDGGVDIVSEVEANGQGVGSEQDAIAAQKFQADGVDMVIPVVGSSSIINFTSAANDQGYTPGYIDFDWASHLSRRRHRLLRPWPVRRRAGAGERAGRRPVRWPQPGGRGLPRQLRVVLGQDDRAHRAGAVG